MSALLEYNGVKAAACVISPVDAHRPVPLRFVWHHVQPEETGGPTEDANLIQLCDSCHYTIHRLLWILRLQHDGTPLTPAQAAELVAPPRRAQLGYAQQGFAACLAAGTADKIPNEG